MRGMHPVHRGQLRRRMLPFDGGDHDLRFGLRAVLFASV